MKKIIWMVLLIITNSFCIAASPITTSENDEINETVTVEVIKTEAVEEVSFSPKEEVVVQEPAPQDVACEIYTDISNDDIELIALVTMAEAEGECEDGKLLVCKLVIEELRNRKNYDVIFFTADRYGNYGTPMFQIGNHYFSSGE